MLLVQVGRQLGLGVGRKPAKVAEEPFTVAIFSAAGRSGWSARSLARSSQLLIGVQVGHRGSSRRGSCSGRKSRPLLGTVGTIDELGDDVIVVVDGDFIHWRRLHRLLAVVRFLLSGSGVGCLQVLRRGLDLVDLSNVLNQSRLDQGRENFASIATKKAQLKSRLVEL